MEGMFENAFEKTSTTLKNVEYVKFTNSGDVVSIDEVEGYINSRTVTASIHDRFGNDLTPDEWIDYSVSGGEHFFVEKLTRQVKDLSMRSLFQVKRYNR